MVVKIVTQMARGFIMGAADVVPGASGGTMALVLGIYQRLIDSISDGTRTLGSLAKGDRKQFWDRFTKLDFAFLLPLGVGIFLAVGSLGSLIKTQLENNPEEMAGLFFGLVMASVVIGIGLITDRRIEHLAIAGAVGGATFYLLGFQSGPIADPSPLVLVGAGALASCAMILPGISGSFILLMIGMYAAVIGAVHDREFGDLLLVAIGAVIGLAVFSSLLAWILRRYFDRVMAALVGLMLGALRVLWPWPNGVGVISETETERINGTGLDWPASDELAGPIVLAFVGAAFVLALARLGERYQPE